LEVEKLPGWEGPAKEDGGAMARKRTAYSKQPTPMVTFSFQDRTYQIDPGRKKVYRRFVEIETSKASEILSTWRAQHSAA
jgi:hypothetical protein